jgi:hypothetical protein
MRINDDAPMRVADENVTTPTLASVSMLIEAVRYWLTRSSFLCVGAANE